MSKKESQGIGRVLTTRRIEALADGIFAFAMTLLVMSLGFPGDGQSNLLDLILKQGHMFFNYALSFVLLAVFWIIHHLHSHVIERTDGVHIWINVFLLMFVTLIPFSTDLAIDYDGQVAAELIFGANLFMVGVCFFANWTYATWNNRLVAENLSREEIISARRRNAVVPCVAALAMVLAVIAPRWGLYSYLLIPVIMALPGFRKH